MSPTQAHHILRQLCLAEPFHTITVRLTNGQEIEVADPLRLALPASPSAGTFLVYVGPEFQIVSLDAVVSVEVSRGF